MEKQTVMAMMPSPCYMNRDGSFNQSNKSRDETFFCGPFLVHENYLTFAPNYHLGVHSTTFLNFVVLAKLYCKLEKIGVKTYQVLHLFIIRKQESLRNNFPYVCCTPILSYKDFVRGTQYVILFTVLLFSMSKHCLRFLVTANFPRNSFRC